MSVLALNISQTLLSRRHMHLPYNFHILALSVKEHYRTVRETHCERLLCVAVLNSQNHSNTLNILEPLHRACLIDPQHPHRLLIHNHLVNLGKI
jgi:hypothetical protein